MPAESLDAELVQVIGGIYDAVIEPGLWADVCSRICGRFDFYNAMLAVSGIRQGGTIVNVAVNVPKEFLAVLTPGHTQDVVAMWGGAQRMEEYPLEEPAVMSSMTDPSGWLRYDYFKVFAVPQGINDVVGIALARDQFAVGTIGFGTHVSRRPISTDDLDRLRIIAPHFRRAVTISGILDDARNTVATFGAALDATASGVVIVDRDGQILHANAAAQPMLDAGDAIQDIGGRLDLREELVPGQLAAAIRATGNEATLGRRGLGIPTRRRDGTPVVVTVMPLQQRTLLGGVPSLATAAVLIAESAAPRLPADALSLLYDLTPAEVRVFEFAVEGHSNSAVATALGVLPSTVKTHMLRVFEKTGVRTRVGLANLSHRIRMPG